MVTNPRAKKGQGAIERSGAARPLKGQGATEYLIIFAAALIIALAAISYLGYQASNSSELTLSDSKLYWQSTARPLQVHDASSVYGELCSQQDMGGYQFLVKNYDPYELTVTGIYIDGVSRDFCFSGRQSSSVLPFTHLSSHLITVPIASGVLPCEEGKMVRIDISFNYRKDNALPQVENGTKPVMFACMNFSAQNDSRLAILFNVTNVTVVPANNSSIVTPPENLSIVTTSIPNSTSGSAYSYFMQATGGSGSYVWSVEGGSLPDGLSLDWPTGEIAGTPDSISCPAPLPGHISTGCIATYRVTIQVSDRDVDGNILQTTQRNFTITNRLQYALTIDQDTLPYALAGSNYSTGLSATGGVAPYSWGVSGLPASLLANSSTGAISGMVDNLSSCLSTLIYTHANNTTALMCAENSSLAITATDSQGGIARKNLTLTRLSPITTFGSCLNITAPGYYALSSDISTSATCIVISAANVTLNCASHSIIGDNTPNSYGIYSNQYNTIVRNCIIRDFEADVFFDTGADSGLIDDTITSATLNEGWNYPGTGILIQGESNRISGSSGNSTYGYGIMVAGSSNTIADSEFIADNYGNAISIYGGASNAISRTNANSSLGAAINAYYSPLTTISDSAGSSTSAEGIIIIEGAGSAITGSSGTSISKLGIGVMSSPDSTITGSTGTSNTDKGIALAGSQNVVISNSIARNLVSSSNGYGLYITYGSDNVQVINTNVSSNQSSAIYIDGGTGVSVDCQGRSMTGRNLTGTYGIYSNQQGTIVKNCQISNFQHGIFFDEVDYGTIQDTVANTTRAAGVGIYIYGYGNGYGLDDAAHNTITGSTGYSATGYGILLDRGHFTSITDSSGISNSGSGIAIGYSDNVGISSSVASTNTGYAALVIGASSNDTITDSTLIARGTQLGVNAGSGVTIGGNSAFNTISNCRITGKGGSAGALFSQQGSNNTFANNTIDGMGGNYVVKLTVSANGNQFIGNTILNAQISLVKLDSSSTSNLFYWNNFTLPIGSAYAIDDAGNNTWNTTIAGHGEGNIWWEIMDGTVQVLGANHSAGFPSLYYGSSGTGYPYNASANPQAKFLCLAQGCADYAPLTPYHE